MKLLGDLDVVDKKVVVRADLDVDMESLSASGLQPSEIVRLQCLKPTVDYLFEKGAKQIIIVGHIGRPSSGSAGVESAVGKPLFYNAMLTTGQLVEPLKKILGRDVVFCPDFGHLSEDKILLFENLRFWPGEINNDQVFGNKLAILGQVYVNEAFGNCHRAHASMVLLPRLIPHAAGLNLQREIAEFTKIATEPVRPFVAVIGGAKLETKLPVIKNLARFADKVLIGGLVALQYEPEAVDEKYRERVIAAVLIKGAQDIDEPTIGKFESVIQGAKTVVWNGPMGHYEEGFDRGTRAVAEAIIASGAESIVGGGETTEYLAKNDLLSKFSFVSSGGGAMLEFLAGKKLPGIEVLS